MPIRKKPTVGRLTGEVREVRNDVWIVAVGLLGAHAMLDDLAETFGVDPVSTTKPR